MKKALRKSALGALRSMDPVQRDRESLAVCDALWSAFVVPAIEAASSSSTHQQQYAASMNNHKLTLLCYLPMYYELSLMPLMHRVWQEASDVVNIYTPLMVPPPPPPPLQKHTPPGEDGGTETSTPAKSSSTQQQPHQQRSASTTSAGGGEMLFVQVLDALDLAASFAPRGTMKILEINDDVRAELVQSIADDSIHCCHSCPSPVLSSSRLSAPNSTRRRGYLCLGEDVAAPHWLKTSADFANCEPMFAVRQCEARRSIFFCR